MSYDDQCGIFRRSLLLLIQDALPLDKNPMVAEYIYQNKVATQSRGVRLWCGGEYCSRLAIFLGVETLKHFFSVGRLVARTHAMEW